MGVVVWALPVVVGLVLPLWEAGPPVGTALSLVIAGLLLKAREVHAEKPGVWFPLLVTGATTFALALTGGSVDWWTLVIDPPVFEMGRFLVGLAVAVGLGFWAWRARSSTVAVTALAYLTAVWYLRPVPPVENFGWMSYEDVVVVGPSFYFPPYPELVVVAGAVLAYARLDRVRPWHVLAIAGLLGSLWHYGALALVVVAAVAAAYELNARRPGAWYPLLLVGVVLVVWPVVDRLTSPHWLGPRLEDGPGGVSSGVVSLEMSAVVAVTVVDYDELFLAVAVAVGLAVWSWRRRSPIMMLTAAAYLGVAYVAANRDTWTPVMTLGPQPPVELVVLAGAAVAFAAAAPGTARTAGRSAGTPGRRPGP